MPPPQSLLRYQSKVLGLEKTHQCRQPSRALQTWYATGCSPPRRLKPARFPPPALPQRSSCVRPGRAPPHSEIRAPAPAFAGRTAAAIVRIFFRRAEALLRERESPARILDAHARDTTPPSSAR